MSTQGDTSVPSWTEEIVNGYIDLLFVSETGFTLVIVDYKTISPTKEPSRPTGAAAVYTWDAWLRRRDGLCHGMLDSLER